MTRKSSPQDLVDNGKDGPADDRNKEQWEKRSEAELEQVSRKVMLGILRSLDASSFRVEKGSDGRFYCTFFEGLLADELDLTTSEIYGQPVEKVFPEQVHNQLQDRLVRVLKGQPQEWITEYKDRHYEFKLPAAGLLKEDSVVGSIADVTERITTNESKDQLLKRLDEAQRHAERLNYTLSHDIRNPLTVILAMCEVAQREIDEGRGAPDKRLQKIRHAANRINEMLTDILKLSRSEHIPPKREDVDVTELSRSVLREFAASEPHRNVEIKVQPGIRVSAEPILTRYLLENLLSNAWKYTSKERDPRIEVFTTQRDGKEWVCVRDNGIGFRQEEKERLFAPFNRSPSARDFYGTGVGLATVKRIVERHDGTVEAWGRPGEGATFCFTLPSGEQEGAHKDARRQGGDGRSASHKSRPDE